MHKAPRSPPPYDVSICVRTSPSRPHSRVGVCSDIPTTMGKAAGAWLCESCKREGCVPETRTSKFLSRPEGLPGRFVHGEFAWTFRNAPEGRQTDRHSRKRTPRRSEKLLVVYMESCLRSLATGQHCGSTGQRIHYYPGQRCGCRLCLRADLYVRLHETKVQDSLRRVDPPRRTDQG